MKVSILFKQKLTQLFGFVFIALFLTACGGSGSKAVGKSSLRVLHLSPDAPAVDVDVNDKEVLDDVTYRQASGFLELNEGINNLKVLAANTDTAVINADVNLKADMKYTVIALDTLENIQPLLIEDSNANPPNGFAAVRVVHGAVGAPAVDVYVTAPANSIDDVSPTLAGVPFKAVSEELEVAAGDYRVRVTAAGKKSVIYDSGTLELANGVEYMAVAARSDSRVSPLGLSILTDSKVAIVNVEDPRARVRAFHASADAPAVDLSIDNAKTLAGVPFGALSQYLLLDAGTYNIDLAATASGTSVINADVPFEAYKEYTIAAVDNLSNITALLLNDDNSSPKQGYFKLRLVHGAPSAGEVDVYITTPTADIAGIEPSISGFEFKQNSGYIEAKAGDYRVRITVAGTKTVAIDTGTISLKAGQIRTAFALDRTPSKDALGVLVLEDRN